MDGQTPIQSDTYHVWVPIDDELIKSVDTDENGDYIVQGIMTSDEVDEEGDVIDPAGMDCSYFLTKGWVKYEHGNRPEQFIGEPIEVRVGRFEHPTLKKSVNGIFVKARLFANRELARQAVKTIEDLQKSNTKRRMGWSIEGSVKERCRKTGKILKSVLRNVVLTMNPVNTTTWVELAKSFASNHQLEVNMDMEKAMDVDALHAVTPQSIEGYDPEKDPQKIWIELFRKFVKEHVVNKSLRDEFMGLTQGEAGVRAHIFAKESGLSYQDACDFASYIAERHEILKSLFGRIGGGSMSKDLASLLDTELEELQKSLEAAEEYEQELQKSANSADEDDANDVDDAEENETDDDEDMEDEDEDGEDDDETNKSIKSDLRKSLAKDYGQAKAFEVSEFLTALTDKLGFDMAGLQKSMTNMTKQQATIIKSLSTMIEAMQDMSQRVEALETENAELRKSLDEVLERPVGRKSIVSRREATTISKSMGGGKPLTQAAVMEILEKSFAAGEVDGREIIRFNAGVPLEQLNLPHSVREKLGLE